MKNLFSTAVIATALALLVPNNGAEATGTAALQSVATASTEALPAMPGNSLSLAAPGPDSKLAWIMSIGFLGVVVTRRLRAD